MPQRSNTDVTTRTEDAAHRARDMTMVNVKALSSRRCGLADRALSLLGRQQIRELSGGETVGVLSAVVGMASWVSLAMFFLFCGYMREVIQAPVVVANVVASFAVHLVAVDCALGLVELRKGFYGLAARAVLCAGRQVEWLSTGHEYSSGVEYSYSRSTFYARGI